ncbi:MAG: hypothetical protein JOZ07_12510 [Solirubrobacterales bacterium]|nr:hypothetical protein [Solirubrobacterales bacterium]
MRLATIMVCAAVAAVAAVALVAAAIHPAPARADVPSLGCKVLGLVGPGAGRTCRSLAGQRVTIVRAGQKLASGDTGGAAATIAGSAASAGLSSIASWITGGARAALRDTSSVIGATTRPDLRSTWFSSAYWRMAGVSALLTLPFLFAAAVQALVRSDLALLLRAAFGYLPLGLIGVGLAAPLTTLLLAASDEMSAIVSGASDGASTSFLGHAGLAVGTAGVATSPFVTCFVALLTAAAAVTLWIELLIREAAVYVVVFLLPLFFAAMVWPARRVWATRAIELLVALILSKFTIVAVLALGGAALQNGIHTVAASSLLAGLTLVLLAGLTPWALIRILPLHEVAASAVGGLRQAASHQLTSHADTAAGLITGEDGAGSLLRRAWAGAQPPMDGAHRMPAADAPPADPGSGTGGTGGTTSADVPDNDQIETAGEEAAAAVASSGRLVPVAGDETGGGGGGFGVGVNGDAPSEVGPAGGAVESPAGGTLDRRLADFGSPGMNPSWWRPWLTIDIDDPQAPPVIDPDPVRDPATVTPPAPPTPPSPSSLHGPPGPSHEPREPSVDDEGRP